MNESSATNRPGWQAAFGLMGLFAGLCTIFALVVTVAEAWQEHAQAQWPQATARVERCGLDPISFGRRDQYYIDCRLSFQVGAEQIVTRIYSRSVPGREVWQYPRNQIAPFEEWVDAHPEGAPIVVRYDPSNHEKTVLLATDAPLGGPHTPTNVKLLAFAAAVAAAFLTIARVIRPRSTAVSTS